MKRHKEGQKDQGEVQELGGLEFLDSFDPSGLPLALPWAPWNRFMGSTFQIQERE